MSIGDDLTISTSRLQEIASDFQRHLVEGLGKEGQMIKALPTFITKLPTGQERGEYLAVDLGGSNLRVGKVTLRGAGMFDLHREKWYLTEAVKVTTKGEILFDFIAECMQKYLEMHWTEGEWPDSFGFTFSYPVKQEGLAHGVLIQWNKAINCHDVVGQDVVLLLHEALRRRGLSRLRVGALLNDTVGTMIAHSYTDPDTRIGVIVGTGTNAAYLERLATILKLCRGSGKDKKGPDLAPPSSSIDADEVMVINTEWGAYGDGPDSLRLLPLTDIDQRLDAATINPGVQRFEKLISGMYMGELARIALTVNGLLVEDGEGREGNRPFSLATEDLSNLLERAPDDIEGMGRVLSAKFPRSFGDGADSAKADHGKRVLQARNVCQLVINRSAHLCAAALVGMYRNMGSPRHRMVVAFDGAVYVNFHGYAMAVKEAVARIHPNHSMVFQVGKSESIIGAAVVVATLAS